MSNHVGCLAVAGSLTSHTVWSRSGRSSTRVMPIARASMPVLPGDRTHRADSLACAPVTSLCCGLLFCALYDVSYSVRPVHKTHATAPNQPNFLCHCSPASSGFASSPRTTQSVMYVPLQVNRFAESSSSSSSSLLSTLKIATRQKSRGVNSDRANLD